MMFIVSDVMVKGPLARINIHWIYAIFVSYTVVHF